MRNKEKRERNKIKLKQVL